MINLDGKITGLKTKTKIRLQQDLMKLIEKRNGLETNCLTHFRGVIHGVL
jgi:hypothetical protein